MFTVSRLVDLKKILRTVGFMAAKMKINVTVSEFSEFAVELRRLADNADRAVKRMQEDKEESFETFGINHAVEGMDSLAGVFAQLVSRYDSRPPELATIRQKIADWRSARAQEKAAALSQIGEDTAAQSKEQRSNPRTDPAIPKATRKPRTKKSP